MAKDLLNITSSAAVPLCDSHAHIGPKEELSERKLAGIPSLLCAANPKEAEKLARLQSEPENSSFLIPTYGLHPWYADRYSLSDMVPYFSMCSVIGEIGMDSVWCDVALSIQEDIFTKQLALATSMQKPVILHTKGQEKKIASLISEYPNTYLVHWYSSPDFPDNYLAGDCYFSIGPDVWWNPSVRRLAAELPADRLLIETDGMGAVKWAFEEAPERLQTPAARAACASVSSSLTFTLKHLAQTRHMSVGDIRKLLSDNFRRCFKLSVTVHSPAEKSGSATSNTLRGILPVDSNKLSPDIQFASLKSSFLNTLSMLQ